jgi:hypothetical protein
LLALHAVRLAGVADDRAVAARFGLDQAEVAEILMDNEALGWVTSVEFGAVGGWTLTERGRAADSVRLREELEMTGARADVERAHRAFESLNSRLVRACTDWQLRPEPGDRLAVNTHGDKQWDSRVLDELGALDSDLRPVVADLAGTLARFGGYDTRFTLALQQTCAGQQQWVTGVGVPSCHAVWMELHEDLLSTLGIPRSAEPGEKG